MKKFIEPKSVALFGVSRRTGTNNVLEHLLSHGYKGKIYPVNPNATEILGVKTYPNIKSVNGAHVDLAVINLPRNLVPGIMGECAEAGINHIIIATQGFSDAIDEEGKEFAKGNPNYATGELNLIRGLQVTDVRKKLGSDCPKEVIEHRNIHLIEGEK